MKKLLGIIGCLLIINGMHASASNAALNDEETRQSICTMIAQGSLTVAVAHQKGEEQATTKQTIDDTIVQLKTRLNANFVDYIAQVWYADIEHIYQLPILETTDEKVAFATMIEELNYSQCMGKMPALEL